jgi:transcriptional regulator with XRE-family HTH domain
MSGASTGVGIVRAMPSNKPPPRPVGDALREWRTAKGLSQTEVAELTTKSQRNISRIELGGDIELDDLVAIEDGLGVMRGTILRLSGHVEDAVTVEDLIATDPTLTPEHRLLLAAALKSFRQGLRGHR